MNRLINVAPMMDYTDRHCRYLLRLINPSALLYTEMVSAQAVLQGDSERLLGFDPAEHPVALQLGGSSPDLLAHAARLGEERGYDEINLNVGCPSDRVQQGRFGACLMAEPGLVAECTAAMIETVEIPVTVKCRIGLNGRHEYEFLEKFVSAVSSSGVSVFVVHARSAYLQGLNPTQTREIHPLSYDIVQRLKREYPELTVVLNGGLQRVEQVREWIPHFDGVMLGRRAYQEPWILAQLHESLGMPGVAAPNREAVVMQYADYVQGMQRQGHRLPLMLRHILGLYAGLPGARAWRRYLSEESRRPGATANVLRHSIDLFSRAA